jgi:hypothetical protein
MTRERVGINKNRKELVNAIFEKGSDFEKYRDVEIGEIGWEQAGKEPYRAVNAQQAKNALYDHDGAKLWCNVQDGKCMVSITPIEYYWFKTDPDFLQRSLDKQIHPEPRVARPRPQPSSLASVPIEPYSGKLNAALVERFYEQRGWIREFGHLRKYVKDDSGKDIIYRLVTNEMSFRVERAFKFGDRKVEWKRDYGGYYKIIISTIKEK